MAGFPEVGDGFGEFVLLERLGRGAMGVVFRAAQPRLDREVAVKVLSPVHDDDAELRARFRREAALQARLDSPHVVTVHDHGEVEGRGFIASQLVTGGDLAQRLRAQGPLAPADALLLAVQVATALEDAHDAGVVHRDVKPANVLLRRGEGVFALLCDFGVARVGDSDLTATGEVLGTYGYLSPEQCRGERGSPLSDQYALGCLLVAALTGSAPYTGTGLSVLQQHQHAPVPALTVDARLDPRLQPVLDRLLAKQPEDRFPDLAEVRRRLERVRSGLDAPASGTVRGAAPPTAVAAPPPEPAASTSPPSRAGERGPARRPARRPGRRGLLVGAAVAIAALGAIGAGVALDRAARAPAGAEPDPSRLTGFDAAVFANQPCAEDRYLVVVATARGDAVRSGKLDDAAASVRSPDEARYLAATGSCAALHPDADGLSATDQAYDVYLGPYGSLGEACAARARLVGEDAPLARARSLDPGSETRLLCSCDTSLAELPTLDGSASRDAAALPARRLLSDVQYLLAEALPTREVPQGARWTSATSEVVRTYQVVDGLESTGVVDRATWASLRAQGCA